MTRRTPSSASRPSNRDDSTRPHRTCPANGIPYPGAPDSASTGERARRTRKTTKRADRASQLAPIPPTVWTAGPDPISPAAAWPVPIIETITTSFSAPGDRVVLAAWPTAGARRSADGAELTAAREAVRALDRDVTASHLGSTTSPSAGASGDLDDHTEPEAERSTLVITTLRPEHGANGSAETLALAAARALTSGGILAVYTHSDWSTGRLTDPSGPLIAAARNADLLYLQHVVVLLTPIRNGRLLPAPKPERTAHTDAGHGTQNPSTRSVHARVHGDVLVFALARADVEPSEDLR